MSNLKQIVKYAEICPAEQLIELDNEVKPGTEFRFMGNLISTDPRFYINLQSSPSPNAPDVPFHFNPRFSSSTDIGSGRDGHTIVIGSRVNGKWTEESLVHPKPFPFEAEKSFDVQIKCEEEQYRISVNGNVIAVFEYKLPLNMIDKILIRGQLKLNLIEINF